MNQEIGHWRPKNAKPLNAGHYYVRQETGKTEVNGKTVYRRNCSIRYWDDTKQSWWIFLSGSDCVPNDSFVEWLFIPGVSDKQ